MPIRHLKNLFDPHSVAVIGASPREGTLGALVMHNLLSGGFEGPILPVTPRHESVAGVLSYPDIDTLPLTPDLALICTPAPTIPAIVRDLGNRGTRAAIILANGLHQPDSDGRGTLRDAVLAEAGANGLRILGPHSLGIMVPRIGLNASGAHVSAAPDGVAFVSQSAAISSSVLDWAKTRGIGFSHFIALGDTADIGFGDVLDYLGSDPYTHAILLFIEGIDQRRTFMSAGRGASRNKPVIVFKAGRVPESLRAAGFHGRPMWGADDVYGSAFRRAGMLRVFRFAELFAAVETLSRARPLLGDRLAVVANGISAAMMVTDGIVLGGARLAEIGADTAASLESAATDGWTRTNPVILAPDAPAAAYAEAVKTLLADKDAVDAVMVLYAPTALSSPDEAARAVIEASREVKRPVLTSWMGDHAVGAARHAFAEAGLPTYDTPTLAVDAFLHMVRFRRNQVMLMETPPSTATGFTPATDAARLVVEGVLADDRSSMTEPEAKAVLSAYGIPTVEAHLARAPEEAVEQACAIGFPVALKIHSPDIDHRADIGGVDLFLDTPDAVRAAADQMLVTVALNAPSASVEGFTVQRMALRPGALELMIGVTTDPVFGPVITFGHGGIAADVVHDRAVALPPLNMSLAGDLIERTRISRLLDGYRDRPGADAEALRLTLVQISQLIVDIPEIVELRINPLFVDAEGVLAVDVRARVARAGAGPERTLAIRPYPKEQEEDFALASGRPVLIRPIRPEDEPEHHELIAKLTPEDIRFRFFGLVSALPHTEMARLTQIDYDREMTFIITTPKEDGSGPETLGVVRTVTDPNNEAAEYAILVRSDLKGQRLGRKLLDKMIHYCRSRGTKRIVGQVLRDNRRMLDLVYSLGFTGHPIPDEDVVEVTLEL